MGNSAIWTNIKMKKIVYLALGGSEQSMHARLDTLRLKREENGGRGDFILVGFSGEIEYMRQYMREFFPRDSYLYAYSWDTLSNIQCCSGNLNNADVVWIATSPLHWNRIVIVLRKFPQLIAKVNWINTEELETKYAKFGLCVYKILGPTFLQWVAKITRWKRYRREYLAPVIERKLCAIAGVYY